MQKNNYRKYFILYFFIFGLLISVVVVGLEYFFATKRLTDDINKRATNEANQKRFIIKDHIDRIKKSIIAIEKSSLFTNFIKKPSTQNRQITQNIFHAFSQENQDFMQIRFINANGMEIIRVNKNDKNTNIASKDTLQSKINRYYFKESIKTNDFWFSKLDLNIENGHIETPYKPTIRISKSIDIDGRRHGIIIVNAFTKSYINDILSSSSFDVYIVDKNANYVVSKNPQKSWALDLNSKENAIKDYPSLSHDMFTKKQLHAGKIFLFSLNDIIRSDQGLYIMFVIKQSIYDKTIAEHVEIGAIIFLIIVVASFILAILMSSIPIKLQKRILKLLRKTQQYSQIINNNVMTMRIDSKGKIKSASMAFRYRTGYTKQEVIGKKIDRFLYKNKFNIDDILQEVVKNKHWKQEVKTLCKDSSLLWVERKIITTAKTKNNYTSYTIIDTDISDKKRIEQISITDPLTKINNRVRFDAEIAGLIIEKTPFSIIICDIDHFKNVNDTYGHQAGDSVLQQFAQILRKNTKHIDLVARFGGEEFVIILAETNLHGACELAEKLRFKIAGFHFDIVDSITASFGVSQFTQDDTRATVLERADKALYKSKQMGRNCVNHED